MLGTWPLGEEKKTPARDEIYYTIRYQKRQNGTTGERIGRFLALAEANRAVITSLDEYGGTTWEGFENQDAIQHKDTFYLWACCGESQKYPTLRIIRKCKRRRKELA